MRRSFLIVAIFTVWLVVTHVYAGELIDRIVATVNGHVVLQSDWDSAVAWEAFSSARPVGALSDEDRKTVLDRLIDQELLREQFAGADAVQTSESQVSQRIEEIRRQFTGAQTEEQWQAVLKSYGFTADQLKARTASQLALMKMVDSKLRPTIQIDPKSVESYYSDELLPQLRQAGNISVSLDEATPKIKEVLTQQKMNEALTAWLHNLRAGSQIHTALGDQETVQ